MSESLQHKLDRVRPPRVQITYDVEIGNAIEMKELPFVVGVLADLSGDRDPDPKLAMPKLKDRKFVEIDRDNFNEIMEAICPRLVLSIQDHINGKTSTSMILKFKNMEKFDPLELVHQVKDMEDIYNSRVNLSDLLTKMDGNDALEEMLSDIVSKADSVAGLKAELEKLAEDSSPDDSTPMLKKIYTEGKLARDESQSLFAHKMLQELVNHVKDDDHYDQVVPLIKHKQNEIDELLSAQLNEILHDKKFQRLEAAWRGLNFLVKNTETSTKLKIRVMNATKHELLKDLEDAIEFDQSSLFKKVYEEEYGTFGGHPYSCLIGDYRISRHHQDLEFLEKISGVAAAAHTPLIMAASPKLFDIDSFEHIGLPRDLAKIFDSKQLVQWKSFRESEDSRYVSLVLPNTLMRLPYGPDTVPVEGIEFTENVSGENSENFCWGNPAYILGQRITNAFALYGWTAAIRGVEGGGIVEDLPAYTFKTSDGDIALKCPTQTAITDRREKELSDLGFISLCHCKGTDYAAFFGGQTTQKPKVYNLDDANANAALSARLPYILAVSRFAHYIKVMIRDKIGSFATKENVAHYLNTWIASYVLLNDDAPQKVKAKYPLREARIDVYDVPGKPGSYQAVVYLRPHFQMEELTASLRLVAKLPDPAAQ